MIVSDASSLILLAKIGLMGILVNEYEVLIPQAVYDECVNEGTLKRFPDALAIQQYALDKKLIVKRVDTSKITFVYSVGQGEKEAIALSLQYPSSILLTDDGHAVKIARYLKRSFTISPLVAVDLYKMDKISFGETKRAIEKLSIMGRYLPNLIADVLLILESVKKEKEAERK